MTTNTTPSTASQAPAVNAREEARKHVHSLTARTTELVGQVIAKGMLGVLEEYIEMQLRMNALESRATAAEAKLEAIRQSVEGLTRWDDNLGMCPVDYGPWIARTEVLSLLQPQEPEPEPKVKYIGGPVEVRITRYKLADPAQPQADESGLPG